MHIPKEDGPGRLDTLGAVTHYESRHAYCIPTQRDGLAVVGSPQRRRTRILRDFLINTARVIAACAVLSLASIWCFILTHHDRDGLALFVAVVMVLAVCALLPMRRRRS